jgi:hypothetical protein
LFEADEDEKENQHVLTEMRMLISSWEDYDFICTKTWPELVASVNKSYDDGCEKEKSNTQFIETLKDRLKKLYSIGKKYLLPHYFWTYFESK